MTKKQYEQLLEWYKDPKTSLEFGPYYDFMCEVYEQCDWSDSGNVLMSTDGCSEYQNIVIYYSLVVKGKDEEEVFKPDWIFSDDYDEYYEELMEDNELFGRMCREYIKYNF